MYIYMYESRCVCMYIYVGTGIQVELRAQHTAVALRKVCAVIDIQKSREALGYGPGHWAVLLASVVSPSWYAKALRKRRT